MPPPAPHPQRPGWQPHPPPYGAPPQQGPGWYPQGGHGYPRPRDTNGFAIASLVCSLVGLLVLVIGPLLGVVFGVVGLRQIPRLGQGGRNLAIAGIVLGGVLLLLDVIALVAIGTDSGSAGPPGVSV